MPQPGADAATDGACWSADVGSCRQGGGGSPAIFWPCRPERSGGPKRSPRRASGAGHGEANFRVLGPPPAVLDEDTKWQIANMARKIDALSLQVDGCLSGIGDLQATLMGIHERIAVVNAGDSPSGTHRSTARSVGESPTAYGGAHGLRELDKLKADVRMGPTSSRDDIAVPKDGFDPIYESWDHQDSQGLGTSSQEATRRQVRRWSSSQISFHMFRPRRSAGAEAIWKFFEEPDSSRAAWWYATLWVPFIFATVLCTLLQSIKSSPLKGLAGGIFELTFDIIFTAEALLRFIVSPSHMAFFQSAYNIIDILAALPLVARLAVGLDSAPPPGTPAVGAEAEAALALLCLAPVLRMLKTLRRFQQFHLFIAVIYFTKEALKFLLLTLVQIVLVFSALIYLVEPRDNIETLPKAMWYVVVTMTTVGYGDITPDTNAGHCIATVLLISSVLFMAMPIGIIGNAFTEMWKDRDRILLNHRFQDRIVQCGYTAHDIAQMFTNFDLNGDGELNLSEFVAMVNEMQLGLQEERAVQLFELIDKDGSGGIDAREFVREFFPNRFHEIYGRETSKAEEKRKKERSDDDGEKRSARSGRKRRPKEPSQQSAGSGEDRQRTYSSSKEPPPTNGNSKDPPHTNGVGKDPSRAPDSPGSAWRGQVHDGLASMGRGEAGTGGHPP